MTAFVYDSEYGLIPKAEPVKPQQYRFDFLTGKTIPVAQVVKPFVPFSPLRTSVSSSDYGSKFLSWLREGSDSVVPRPKPAPLFVAPAKQKDWALWNAASFTNKSEGFRPGYKQGGLGELFGWREGTSAYRSLSALDAKLKSRKASTKQREAAVGALSSSLLVVRAKKNGADKLAFSPKLQANFADITHMRGESGARYVMELVAGTKKLPERSSESAVVSSNPQLSPEVINRLSKMSDTELAQRVRDARIAYDKAVYGWTKTTVDSGTKQTSGNWWEVYKAGLVKRYNEAMGL